MNLELKKEIFKGMSKENKDRWFTISEKGEIICAFLNGEERTPAEYELDKELSENIAKLKKELKKIEQKRELLKEMTVEKYAKFCQEKKVELKGLEFNPLYEHINSSKRISIYKTLKQYKDLTLDHLAVYQSYF